MKGLLLKDYIILKKQKFFLLLLVFYILLAPFAKTFAWYGLAILMSTFLSISLMAWDEKAKSDRYYLAMPYSRNDVVLERYVFGLLAVLAVALLCCIIAAVASIFQPALQFRESVFFIAIAGGMALILQALAFPFVFKLGVEKGRITSVLFVGVLAGACAYLLVYSSNGGEELLADTMKLGTAVNTLFAFAVIAVLWGLSLTLSMAFYQKREF